MQIKPTLLKQPFNYDTDLISKETGLKCTDPSLTQQHTAEQTDINYIVKQFANTGTVPQPIRLPTYGDFSGVDNYQDALELIKQATDSFNSLPAEARAHFSNDPAIFLDYIENAPDPQILANLGLADIVQLPDDKTSDSE
jgi:phage internal scaffolding protein